MIYERAAPDCSRLKIRWLPHYGRWEVTRDRDRDWYESRRLALALSAATGHPADAAWIRAIEAEVGGEGDELQEVQA